MRERNSHHTLTHSFQPAQQNNAVPLPTTIRMAARLNYGLLIYSSYICITIHGLPRVRPPKPNLFFMLSASDCDPGDFVWYCAPLHNLEHVILHDIHPVPLLRTCHTHKYTCFACTFPLIKGGLVRHSDPRISHTKPFSQVY